MDDAEVEEEQEQKKERILIPVANADTLDKLMQLALVQEFDEKDDYDLVDSDASIAYWIT